MLMSERSESLTAPQQVRWIHYGDAGSTIAEQVQAILPEAADPPSISATTPIVVIADADAPPSKVAVDLQELTARREHRVWFVLPPDVPPRMADDVLTKIDPEHLDAVIRLRDAPPKLSAVALAAWILLRHDAPSSALSGLRDTNGEVCNLAVISGAAPASPPQINPGPSSRRHLDIRDFLPDMDAESTQRAEVLVESCGSDYVQALAEIPGVAKEIADSTATRIVEVWRSASAEDLNAALDTIPDHSEETATGLAAAMLRVGELSAAIEREQSGFGSWWGRRRRLAELQSQLATARSEWVDHVCQSTVSTTRQTFRGVVDRELRARIEQVNNEERARAGKSRDQAYRSWFAGAEATAASLPAIKVADVHHAWGSASPQTRRHLLVPMQEHAPARSDTDVIVHEVDGLSSPLAAAIMLGLPVSSTA